MGTLIYFIFTIFAPCDTGLNLITYFRGAATKTVMWGSLLPKANGGGDRRAYAHSKRAIQRILCSVFTVTGWHDDTSFSTFRLARGQAGKIRPKVPACPRESKSSEITVTSVTLSPRSRCLRSKSQLLTIQKSVTCDAKVSYLRYESLLLTMQKTVTYASGLSTGWKPKSS